MSEAINILMSAEDYFKESLVNACKKRNLTPNQITLKYIAQLLESFLSSDQFFNIKNKEGKNTQKTLAELYLESQNANKRHEKQRLLKRLGDIAYM